jgi:hypothetical protein
VESFNFEYLLEFGVQLSAESINEVEQLRQRLDRISSGLQAIYELDSAHKRLSAPDFNLFRILGLERREATHSAFIAELLNPKGTHGQGIVGLECFFRMLSARYPDLAGVDALNDPGRAIDWEVRTEQPISGDGDLRRLDIVIGSRSRSLLIVIENKIDAGDQPEQLAAYAKWLSSQSQSGQGSLLFYLTIDGRQSSTAGDANYRCLSYRDDIRAWLEDLSNRVQAPHVRAAIDQYLAILPVLVSPERRGAMPDAQLRDAIVSFMRNPTILRDAWEIAEWLEETRNALVEEFWKDLEAAVKRDPRTKGWTVRFFKPSPSSKTAIQIYPESCIEEPAIYFCVEQAYQSLDCGIFWDVSKNVVGKPGMDELNLSAPEWQGDSQWWVAYKRLTERCIRDKETILGTRGKNLKSIQKDALEYIGYLIEHCGAKVRELALKQTTKTP